MSEEVKEDVKKEEQKEDIKYIPPRIEIVFDKEKGDVILNGEIPRSSLMAYGMLERAKQLLIKYYFQAEAIRNKILDPKEVKLDTNPMKRFMNNFRKG